MPQFDATIKHLKEGVKSMTVSAAVKNIEGWEATLAKVDEPTAKTIIKDLESLKKHLHAKELDGGAIRKLVVKLGKETYPVHLPTTIGMEEAGTVERAGAGVTGFRPGDRVADCLVWKRREAPPCRRQRDHPSRC